jgi:hypothetical protein
MHSAVINKLWNWVGMAQLAKHYTFTWYFLCTSYSSMQVTQYYMNFSAESGLPEGEEERQEKLNDLLDDQQVRLACPVPDTG